MATTVTFTEYNGSGATATANRTEMNLKAIDDSTTNYLISPVLAGQNSYTKYQAPVHSGTYTSLSNGRFYISGNTPGTGQTITGSVVTSYTTPTTSTSGDSAMNTGLGISTNYTNGTNPFATGTATYSTGGTVYANALRLQLQTATSAPPGPNTSQTITYAWTEN